MLMVKDSTPQHLLSGSERKSIAAGQFCPLVMMSHDISMLTPYETFPRFPQANSKTLYKLSRVRKVKNTITAIDL